MIFRVTPLDASQSSDGLDYTNTTMVLACLSGDGTETNNYITIDGSGEYELIHT